MARPLLFASLALSIAACDGATGAPPAAPDASTDARADIVTDVTPDLALDVAPDVAPDAAAEPSADIVDAAPDAPAACTAPDAVDLLRALRTPRPAGVSAVAAPGLAFEDLRARFDTNPAAMTLLAQARTSARRTVPTLAPGALGTYQTVASLALAAALVAWHDRDATYARTALGALAAAAVTTEWFQGSFDVPIFVGASLVDLAAAVDLLGAASLSSADLTSARDSLARALNAVEGWLQGGGTVFLAFHEDNHGVRFASGVIAAGMVASPDPSRDELLAFALSQMSASIARQTGNAEGWAEGSTYFEYAFEVGAPTLAALDRVWPDGDTRCVRCPGHAFASCATAAQPLTRPTRDPRVTGLMRWGAALESRGGWAQPIDDSRLMGMPSPLFERLLGANIYNRWSPTGPTGSVGGSVNVGPLVALALASPPLPSRLPVTARWPGAGTARLDGTTPSGTALEAFLLAEHDAARRGAGHERPDVLALHVAVGGTLMLGGSGYRDYDARAPLARADAATVITVEPEFPRATGAGESGPDATLAMDGVGGSFTVGGVTVSRTLTAESGALVVYDRVDVAADAREVTWHWHLRGALDATRWQWTVGTTRCEATQTGEALPVAREMATHYDDYSRMETHPVVRQRARLVAGRHELTTRIVCDPVM